MIHFNDVLTALNKFAEHATRADLPWDGSISTGML
jgi:hypothetical protein